MKRKALDSFENSSKQLVKQALELSTAKDKEDGTSQSTVRLLRHELIATLELVLRSLLRLLKM